MKKINMLLLLVLLTATAHAQRKGFMIGIKGGVNLSKLTMGDFLTTRYNANGVPTLNYNGQEVSDNLRASFDSRTGYSGGVFMRFGRNLYIQPELLYSTRSGNFEIVRNDRPDQPTIQTVNINLTSVDVPILVGLKGGPFRINAGPMASFRVGDNQKLNDALRYYTSGTLSEAFTQALWGYQVGAGIDILGISLDVRREGMLSDLASTQIGAPNAPIALKQKLSSWQVTVGIKLL
jgi:Outer membrane protein beta-barrel domain